MQHNSNKSNKARRLANNTRRLARLLKGCREISLVVCENPHILYNLDHMDVLQRYVHETIMRIQTHPTSYTYKPPRSATDREANKAAAAIESAISYARSAFRPYYSNDMFFNLLLHLNL